MSKIIKITDDFVLVAEADKSITKVPISAFDFTPRLNQQIEVYQLDEEYIVNEVEKIKFKEGVNRSKENDIDSIQDKIHINIINENKPQNITTTTSTNANTNTNVQNNPSMGYSEYGTVSKWAFVFVSLFLGVFGGNFFMLKKPLMGVLSILFFWTSIPMIIGLYHGVVALFKRPDAYGRIRM